MCVLYSPKTLFITSTLPHHLTAHKQHKSVGISKTALMFGSVVFEHSRILFSALPSIEPPNGGPAYYYYALIVIQPGVIFAH